MPDDSSVYIFQLSETREMYEVEAENSAEALRQCLREKKWPIEKVVYLGRKEEA